VRRTMLMVGLAVISSLGIAAFATAAGAPTSKSTIVKLYVVHSPNNKEVLALVKIKINGHSFVFAIDTGASTSLIDAKAARVFALPTVRGSQKGAGVSCVFVAQKVKVTNWSIGSLRLSPETLVTSSLPFSGIQGLLGSDILSRYSTVEIDYQHGLLKLGGPQLHA
jgi:hypothetical protein